MMWVCLPIKRDSDKIAGLGALEALLLSSLCTLCFGSSILYSTILQVCFSSSLQFVS